MRTAQIGPDLRSQTIKTETSVLNKILIIPVKEVALKTIYKLANAFSQKSREAKRVNSENIQ